MKKNKFRSPKIYVFHNSKLVRVCLVVVLGQSLCINYCLGWRGWSDMANRGSSHLPMRTSISWLLSGLGSLSHAFAIHLGSGQSWIVEIRHKKQLEIFMGRNGSHAWKIILESWPPQFWHAHACLSFQSFVFTSYVWQLALDWGTNPPSLWGLIKVQSCPIRKKKPMWVWVSSATSLLDLYWIAILRHMIGWPFIFVAKNWKATRSTVVNKFSSSEKPNHISVLHFPVVSVD